MYLLVLFVSSVYIGCTTSPVAFSFLEDEQNTSSIAFKQGNPGISLVSYNGLTLPKPENGKHWDPITFPSGIDLRIIVHASYQTKSKTTLGGFGLLGAAVNLAQDISAVSRNVDVDLEFTCPPLEAGKSYQLSFTKEPGLPGKNILTLTEAGTVKVIYQQEFEVKFGGTETK
jgi:hypothetical protein